MEPRPPSFQRSDDANDVADLSEWRAKCIPQTKPLPGQKNSSVYFDSSVSSISRAANTKSVGLPSLDLRPFTVPIPPSHANLRNGSASARTRPGPKLLALAHTRIMSSFDDSSKRNLEQMNAESITHLFSMIEYARASKKENSSDNTKRGAGGFEMLPAGPKSLLKMRSSTVSPTRNRMTASQRIKMRQQELLNDPVALAELESIVSKYKHDDDKPLAVTTTGALVSFVNLNKEKVKNDWTPLAKKKALEMMAQERDKRMGDAQEKRVYVEKLEYQRKLVNIDVEENCPANLDVLMQERKKEIRYKWAEWMAVAAPTQFLFEAMKKHRTQLHIIEIEFQAASCIQKAWRGYKEKCACWKRVHALVIMTRHIPLFRFFLIKRRRRKTLRIVVDFMRQLQMASALTKRVSLFKAKVVRCQRFFRTCFNYRLFQMQVTCLQWDSTEERVRERVNKAIQETVRLMLESGRFDLDRIEAMDNSGVTISIPGGGVQSPSSPSLKPSSAANVASGKKGNAAAAAAAQKSASQQQPQVSQEQPKPADGKDNNKSAPMYLLKGFFEIKKSFFDVKMKIIQKNYEERRLKHRKEIKEYHKSLKTYQDAVERERMLKEATAFLASPSNAMLCSPTNRTQSRSPRSRSPSVASTVSVAVAPSLPPPPPSRPFIPLLLSEPQMEVLCEMGLRQTAKIIISKFVELWKPAEGLEELIPAMYAFLSARSNLDKAAAQKMQFGGLMYFMRTKKESMEILSTKIKHSEIVIRDAESRFWHDSENSGQQVSQDSLGVKSPRGRRGSVIGLSIPGKHNPHPSIDIGLIRGSGSGTEQLLSPGVRDFLPGEQLDIMND